MKSHALWTLLAACASLPAAETGSSNPVTAAPAESETELPTVEVTANAPIQRITPSFDSITGDALKLQQADSLGQTLQNQMGVANASFGPGVGLPVIRGLTGSRVRIMQDGIGSHDASFLSPEHASAIEPLFAEQIEVARGPDTIRYGGNAIGGMVNVKDNRIPERVPERLLQGALEQRFDTNADGTNSGFKLDLGRDQVAFKVGGFHRNRNDTEIPGEAIAADAVREQFGLSNVLNAHGTIPNTDSESVGGFLGASWLGDHGMAGMSVGHFTNRYGIPKSSHGVDPSSLDGLELILPDIDPALLEQFADILSPQALNPDIRIDMRQTRYDFKSEWYAPLRGIDKAAFRCGLVDYTHTELEGPLPFTTFNNQVGEGRFEIEHHLLEPWSGTLGAQWQDRYFSALGVETFVPPTNGDTLGLFTLQKLAFGQWQLELGLRTERSRIDPAAAQLAFPAPPGQVSIYPAVALPGSLNFRADSVSLAASWQASTEATLSLSLNRAKRSPDIQELLALGPHLSTRSFEIGNVRLGNETANLADLGLDWHSEHLAAKINAYANWTEQYIYQKRQPEGFYNYHEAQFYPACVNLIECLPVYAYSQRDALFLGYEAEAQTTLADTRFGQLKLTMFSDFVRGRFADDDVPRLPPLRLGTEIGFGDQRWNAALRYTRGQMQNRPGNGETATPGYHLLSASVDYHWRGLEPLDLWLFAKANNLLNEEIRSSVSFLRNFAPEPGRSVVLGFRATF